MIRHHRRWFFNRRIHAHSDSVLLPYAIDNEGEADEENPSHQEDKCTTSASHEIRPLGIHIRVHCVAFPQHFFKTLLNTEQLSKLESIMSFECLWIDTKITFSTTMFISRHERKEAIRLLLGLLFSQVCWLLHKTEMSVVPCFTLKLLMKIICFLNWEYIVSCNSFLS